jgi:hypothetical protein
VDENPVRQYLLGDLAFREQEQLEERLLTNDESYEQLLVAEDELIDDYLRGALHERERERFEQHFLSTPERYRKLRFARSLRRYIASATAGESPAPVIHRPVSPPPSLLAFLRTQYPVVGVSLAAALLLIALGGVWLAAEVWRLQGQLDQMRAEQAQQQASDFRRQLADVRARSDRLAEQLQREQSQRAELEQKLARLEAGRAPAPRPAIFSLVLTPGLTRDSGGMKRVSLPPNISQVQMQLVLETDDHPRYQAALQTIEGDEVKTWGPLEARAARGGKIVSWNMSASLVPAGDYQVKLSGLTAGGEMKDVNSYYFRVARR